MVGPVVRGPTHKLVRHLKVSEKVAQKLVDAGYLVPSRIRKESKRTLRTNAGLTRSEVNAVKARWS